MSSFYNKPDFPRIEPSYIKSTVRENGKWKCDYWTVVITSGSDCVEFDYYTGMGLRENGIPVFPSIPEFLYSLILDYDSAFMPFYEFVNEFGYDTDTVEQYRYAESIYHACIDNRVKMERVFSKNQIDLIRKKTENL